MPNHYIGDLLHTIGMSGLSRVRTELLPLAIVLTLAPHPVQMHRCTASLRAIATFAIFRPRRIARWKRRTQPRNTYSLAGLLYSERRLISSSTRTESGGQ
jgi:hypothetical protein